MAKYFKDKEFACKCGCGFCDPDLKLLETLDLIREEIGKPILVTSGCRCQLHNKNVGGVHKKENPIERGAKGLPGDSDHSRGTAADIIIKGMNSSDYHKIIKKMYKEGRLPLMKGLGLYIKKNFVHVSVEDINNQGKRLREWKE